MQDCAPGIGLPCLKRSVQKMRLEFAATFLFVIPSCSEVSDTQSNEEQSLLIDYGRVVEFDSGDVSFLVESGLTQEIIEHAAKIDGGRTERVFPIGVDQGIFIVSGKEYRWQSSLLYIRTEQSYQGIKSAHLLSLAQEVANRSADRDIPLTKDEWRQIFFETPPPQITEQAEAPDL